MDVTCARCKEPWDIYHLRHDEIWETEAGGMMIDDKLDKEKHGMLSPGMRKVCPFKPRYNGELWEGTLTPFWREQFEALGWKFGPSLYAVLACPCCKGESSVEGAEERIAAKMVISELLEGDDDGIAAMMEDLDI